MLLVVAALVFASWIATILLLDPDGFRRSSRRTITKRSANNSANSGGCEPSR